MRRAVLVVFLALLSFQVSGVAAALGDGPCEDEDCPGDVSGGQCPPNGHCCSCCSLPTVLAPTGGAALAIPEGSDATWTRSDDRIASPEPDDILHVPRPLLA